MKIMKFYKKFGIYILLLVEVIAFSILADNFLSAKNLLNILRQISMLGIVASGATFVLMTGGMDLSIGGQMAVNGLFTAVLMVNYGIPPFLAILASIVLGCVLGALNGLISVKFRLAPIIVTLGTMMVWEGFAYVMTDGLPVFGFPESFAFIGQGYVSVIPFPVIIMIVVVVIAAFILNKTYFGRYIIALGGNGEAARLAGINVDRLTVIVYAIGGFFTSIGSVVLLSRTNSAQPAAGAGYSFDCITASVLGGVSVQGGKGNIMGAFVGVVFIGVMNNAFILMGLNDSLQDVFKGLILLAAVALDNINVTKKTLVSE